MKKKVFSIGTGVFGEGKPKICVPIVEKTREEILKRAEEIANPYKEQQYQLTRSSRAPRD